MPLVIGYNEPVVLTSGVQNTGHLRGGAIFNLVSEAVLVSPRTALGPAAPFRFQPLKNLWQEAYQTESSSIMCLLLHVENHLV